MKMSLLLLVVATAFSTGALAEELSPDTWEEAYSKRNVRLGITLEEFLKIPFPDESEYHYVVPRPKCSNDPIAEDYIYMQFLSDQTGYEKVGAIKCGYYGTMTFMVNPYMNEQRLEQISPLLVDWAPTTNYYFFKPDGGTSYFLFHIAMEPANFLFWNVARAFEEALGPPTHRESVDLQNAFGATVTSTTLVWENRVSKIKFVSNNGQIDRHTLDYELTPILKIVKDKLESIQKTSRSRI